MRSPAAAAALLILLCIPVVFWDLGRYGPANMDELFYHYVARRMLETGDWLRLEYTGEHRLYDTFLNAPLYYWAKATSIAALGDSWWSMRILSALCGVGTVLVTWQLVRRLSSPAAGLMAGMIQLTTFQFVYLHSARTGEMETAVTLLTVASAALFLRALREGGGFWGHHLCLLALAHLKLPLAALPLAAELAFFALDRDARGRLREWLWSGLALLPLALVWRVFHALADWDGFVEVAGTMFSQAAGETRATAREHGGVLGNLRFYAETLLIGAWPWSLLHPLALVGLLAREREGEGERGWQLLALYAAAVLGFFVLVSKHYPWYVIPVYPFLSAFTGVWLWRLWRDGPRPWELAGLGLAVAVALFLRVPGLDFDPFSAPARIGLELAWGTPLGIPAAFGVPALGLVLAGLGVAWRKRAPARLPAAGLVAGLAGLSLMVAGVRVVAPLRFTGYEAPAETLRERVDDLRARGEPLPYPLEYVKGPGEHGLMKLRYFFWEDFWIVPLKEGPGQRVRVVHLYERARGRPPVAPTPDTRSEG